MVKKPRREVQTGTPVTQFRDAKKNTITQLSLEDLDRINTPGQTSVLEPPRLLLKDAERFRENEIRLRYELDLAKQLAADNYREAESAKARLNDLLMKNPASPTVPASPTDFVVYSHIAKIHDPFSQIYEGGFVGGHTITDRLPALCRRRRPPTISNGDGQFTL